jgi:hypothetical protein
MIRKTNYNNPKSRYIPLLYTVTILALVINSCKCNKNDGNVKNGGNSKNEIVLQGLRIATDRASIKGSESFTVSIQADEVSAADIDINLVKFKLKASITTKQGDSVDNNKLEYIDNSGNRKSNNTVNEYITFENQNISDPFIFKHITFSINPDLETSALTIVLELLDEDDKTPICKKEEVLWQATSTRPIQLRLDGLIELQAQTMHIKNEQEWKFYITDIGKEETNLDDITIIATTTNGTKFSLNGHPAQQPIPLKTLLSSHLQKVHNQQRTIPIKLKLTDSNKQTEDQVVLTLIRNGENLVSTAPMSWKYVTKGVPLFTSNTKSHINGNEMLEILTIKENQTSNWDDIKLSIKSTNNVIFRINDKPFESGNLNKYFTESSPYNSSLNLCLYSDPDEKKESRITLVLTQEKDEKVIELDKKIIDWDNKEINLAFIRSDSEHVIGNQSLPITIQNTGDPISTKDIIISTEVTVDLLNIITSGRVNKPDFYLNGRAANDGLTLQEVLGETSPRRLAHNEVINSIELQVGNTNSCKKSKITVILKSNDKEWKSAPYKWIYKNIKFSFQDLPNKELEYEDNLQLRIKNKGGAIYASKLSLKISNKEVLQNIPLHFNGKYQVKPNSHLMTCQLSTLLSEDRVIQAGEVLNIDINRITTSNYNPYLRHRIALGLSTEADQRLVGLKEFIWKEEKPNLQVKIASPKNNKTIIEDRKILRGNNQHFKLIIFNKGSHYIFKETPDLYLQIKQIQENSIIKKPHIEKYWNGKDSYLIPLNSNTVDNASNGLLTKNYHAIQISNQQELYIYPIKQEKSEYKIQLCQGNINNLTPIGTPVTIIWEPKNINIELQLIGEEMLKDREKEIQFGIVNQADTLKKEDGDILQIKIERLGDKKARLTALESSFHQATLINKQATFISGNLLNKNTKEINKLPSLLPRLLIRPSKTEDYVCFKFTLLYKKKSGNNNEPLVMGKPIYVTWTRN